MFVKSKAGQAESAINFYLSVFKNTKRGATHRYPAGLEWEKEGNIMFADLMLENSWFAVMDSGREHNFDFNEAISFVVQCADQAEIDYYWQKLSAVPESEQCGWCKDQFGVSWQITPVLMEEMLSKGSEEQKARLVDAFLPMKKIDIATLKKAYEGK
jgi:predicted 3-demethylubiquinone-9 3-methyltransferase (glyoxalase superfamily)